MFQTPTVCGPHWNREVCVREGETHEQSGQGQLPAFLHQLLSPNQCQSDPGKSRSQSTGNEVILGAILQGLCPSNHGSDNKTVQQERKTLKFISQPPYPTAHHHLILSEMN